DARPETRGGIESAGADRDRRLRLLGPGDPGGAAAAPPRARDRDVVPAAPRLPVHPGVLGLRGEARADLHRRAEPRRADARARPPRPRPAEAARRALGALLRRAADRAEERERPDHRAGEGSIAMAAPTTEKKNKPGLLREDYK